MASFAGGLNGSEMKEYTEDKPIPEAGEAVHIVGIGGVGMNALAQMLRARGCVVTGSDRQFDQGTNSALKEQLVGLECRLFPQDGVSMPPDTKALVISSAIEEDNPDRLKALERGIVLWHRAELLAALIGPQPCLAVSGTSGKTTVTGMLGWVLSALGWNPGVVNGGGILNWKNATTPGNVRAGAHDHWVIEVDESDRSLLQFNPEWAILTNVSADHFLLDESRDLFRAFARQVKSVLVCSPDDAGWLCADSGMKADLVVADPTDYQPWPLQVLGAHNQTNATMVAKMAQCLGYDEAGIREALSQFQGIERRLERVGEVNGATVYDEYAHNPAKIRAAWTTIAEHHDRVLGVWRPHGYGPLAAMAADLCEMWAETCRPQDICYLLPVYYAGGTATRKMESADLVNQLVERGVNARMATDYATLKQDLLLQAGADSAILCMGARDPALPLFARELTK